MIKNHNSNEEEKSNLAGEVGTKPTAADAPIGGMSTTVDAIGLVDVEVGFPSDALVIPEMIESKCFISCSFDKFLICLCVTFSASTMK